eukprot:g362.t1
MLIHPDEDEGKITTSDIPFQAATVLIVDEKTDMIKSHKERARDIERE